MTGQLDFFAAETPTLDEPLALFSPCRTWRYLLRRPLAATGKRILVVGQNPSTADERKNDTTSRQLIFFGRREGGRELRLGNLGAFCATESDEWTGAEAAGKDPIGPDNMRHLREEASRADLMIAAWGASGNFRRAKGVLRDLDKRVLALLTSFGDVYCFGRTATGEPRHPSRLAHATPLELYAARAA